MRILKILSALAVLLVLTDDTLAQSRWMSQFEDGDGNRYEIDVRGEVRFTDDDSGVAGLSPDGSLTLVYRGPDGLHELAVRPSPAGGLAYEYEVDGRKAAYDDRARRRLAPVFLEIIRQSGINAEQRVARILERDGVEGVMEEIRHIGSSGANGRYFIALVDQGDLTDDQLVRLVRMAPDRIPSSGDRTRFLIYASSEYLADDRVAEAYFDVACTVQSSGDRSRVLIAALDRDELSTAAPRSLLVCARSIPSSGDLARVLIAAAPYYSDDVAHRDAYFDAVDEIASSGDRARVLVHLLDTVDLDEASLGALLRAASGISSGGDRSRVLVRAAPRIEGDGLVEAYLHAAESISSSGDRGRALAALIAQD